MKLVRCLTIIVFLCVSGSCMTTVDGMDRSSCYRLATTFFEKGSRQRVVDFAAYNLPDRYAIYICGMQYMHPPVMELAAPFAAEGAPAAVFLQEKLASTADDRTIRDIVLVYSEMQRLRFYDVAADEDLMALIRKKAASVTDREWHEHVATIVARIAQPSIGRKELEIPRVPIPQ